MANHLKLKDAFHSRGITAVYTGDKTSPQTPAGFFSRNIKVPFLRGVNKGGAIPNDVVEDLRKHGAVK